MAVGYNPRAVTDGLVLALDAGSPKNYNAGISTNWTDKVGGNNGTLVGGTHHNDGPFVGAGYVEFDGTGDYLSLASSTDFSFSHDFTVEAWAYPTDITSDGSNSKYKAIFSLNVSGEWNSQGYGLVLSIGNLHYGLDNTDYNNGIIPINTWTHLAVTRSNGAIRIFVNGILDQTIDDSNSDVTFANGTGNIPAVGLFDQHVGFPRFYFTGYISNLRILKGTALYTSNFTPPTKSLTAITNTVLLTCQGNTIADASSSAHTITANGDISLTKEPFAGAGAVYFDGTGDYLSVADGTDFTLGTDNFTLECWVYLQSDSLQIFLGQNDGNLPTSSIDIRYSSGTITAYAFSGHSAFSRSGSAAQNSWHHIAWVRDGSAMRLFINGTQTTGTSNISTNSINDSSEQFGVGACNGSGGYKMTGYLSNVRLIKGTALYTSNFTPPSRTLEPIENTVLLTCQGQNIKDASSNAHAISVNGDAKATIVSSSFEFDGTDDEVSISSYQLSTTNSSAPYTLSAWINRTGSTTDGGIITQYVTGSSAVDRFGLREQNSKLSWWKGGSDLAISTNNIPTNVWKYIVGVKRSDNSVSIYIDGIEVGTGTDNLDFENATLKIGRFGTIAPFSGNISQVSIYNRALTASEIQQNYNALKGRYA